jgi:hypothetical protein
MRGHIDSIAELTPLLGSIVLGAATVALLLVAVIHAIKLLIQH